MKPDLSQIEADLAKLPKVQEIPHYNFVANSSSLDAVLTAIATELARVIVENKLPSEGGIDFDFMDPGLATFSGLDTTYQPLKRTRISISVKEF